VVWYISKSPLSVSWPAAGLISIIVALVDDIGYQWLLLATILWWGMQLLFWLFHASKVAKYIPQSVIQGMLSWIGAILLLKQIPLLFGVSARWPILSWSFIVTTTLYMLALSVICIVLWWIRSHSKKARRIPMGIAIVLISSIIALFIPLPANQLIAIPTTIWLSDLRVWSDLSAIMSQLLNPLIWKWAITIAIVASVETILSIHAIDHMDEKKRVTPMDRELIAQWAGNMISGLLWGLPITSVIVRSTVNHHAWATSKRSTIFHWICIAIVLFLFPAIINYVPIVALAVILIATGYKLCSPHHIMKQFTHAYPYRISFMVTLVMVVATDLLLWVALWCIVYYSIQPKYLIHIFGHRSWLYISQK
jgi:MFS superfamily sulfate permease-like transporter